MDLKAIILAAGKGSRLIETTFGSPKPLIDINGISLIQRQIDVLNKKNIKKITIIRGYKLSEFQLKNVNYIDCRKYFWKEIDSYKDLCSMKKIVQKKIFKF